MCPEKNFLFLQALEEAVDKKVTTADEENRSAQESTKTSQRSGLLEHNFDYDDYDDCDETKEGDGSNDDKEISRATTVDQIDSFKGESTQINSLNINVTFDYLSHF